MSKFKDISGQRFGQLVAIEPRGKLANGLMTWLCRCDCGGACIVRGNELRSGHTKSCRHKRGYSRYTKKGGKYYSIYMTWCLMHRRCKKPDSTGFKYYGGRGITVCERWNSFTSFLADVGERPAPGFTIDRIDNDGNYEPSNVRWATREQQMANRRSPARALQRYRAMLKAQNKRHGEDAMRTVNMTCDGCGKAEMRGDLFNRQWAECRVGYETIDLCPTCWTTMRMKTVQKEADTLEHEPS